MNIVVLDFESYFTDDYQLKKLTTEEYVRDPRFSAHGLAVWQPPHGTPTWVHVPPDDIDWANTAVLCQHAQFDGLILSHHYGIRPALWLDTLSMARAVLGNHLPHGLDALRQHFGMPVKRTPYHLFINRTWEEMAETVVAACARGGYAVPWGTFPGMTVQQLVAEGACDEVESIWAIFNTLMQGFPPEELMVIDHTIRMFTEPRLRANAQLLGELWLEERDKRAARYDQLRYVLESPALAELGIKPGTPVEKIIGKNEAFAALLREAGVEPEYKRGKNDLIYAFAKTDDFMQALLEDEDDYIALLAEARLGVKSTIQQTRAARIGDTNMRGPLPCYLKYCGARTIRWSGGDKMNWQNFNRSDPETKKVSKLRQAVEAPDGYLIAGPDESQIECRMLNTLAGQEDVLERFRRGEDPYVGIASAFYGERVYKASKGDPREDEMAAKRGTGKQAELSCGYGSGGPKFVRTAALGTYGPKVYLTQEEGKRFVGLYRETHPKVCDWKTGYWAECEHALSVLGAGRSWSWGPLEIENKRIWLPNGLPLIYDTLEWAEGPQFLKGRGWQVKNRNGWEVMYGSKLAQHICEALSRCVVSQAMLRIYAKWGLRSVLTVHDSLIYLLPDDDNAATLATAIEREMAIPPEWLPNIPLDVEGYLGRRMEK